LARGLCPSHFGFLANRFRASRLALGRQLLGSGPSTRKQVHPQQVQSESSSLWHCPRCGSTMVVIHRSTAAELSATRCQSSSSSARPTEPQRRPAIRSSGLVGIRCCPAAETPQVQPEALSDHSPKPLPRKSKAPGLRFLALCSGSIAAEIGVFTRNDGLLGKLPVSLLSEWRRPGCRRWGRVASSGSWWSQPVPAALI